MLFLIAAALPVGRVAAYEYAEVSLDYVAAKAQQRAQKPFHSPDATLPDFLREDKLDYDKYREIEFRHEDALWANRAAAVSRGVFSSGLYLPGADPCERIHADATCSRCGSCRIGSIIAR